jgi:phosphoglycerol transferase MdoB-like AlkP superfamily enzyme
MIIDFWYLLLIFFGIIYFMYKLYPSIRITKIKPENKLIMASYSATGKILLFLLFTSFLIIGFRGGIQFKPLNIISASQYGTGKTTTLVLNTSFTVVKTFGKKKIDDIHWMSEQDAVRISPVIKSPDLSAPFNPKNIVIIILESFGKEYIGSLNLYKGYTPFLDSLISKSLIFSNAYANGKRSIEGIPAIIAGIPALMPEPFITSSYSGNSITTLPSLLKSKGYSSIFFHGGTNGTMGFDNFTKSAGYDSYFGRTEYNDDMDFDGSWGIYDEPFLQRTASELNKTNTPFIASIFTISSHHPYKIPEKYSGRFPSGTLPIHESIGYADYSLKRFFDSASKMNWFSNTLFVITADHTALSEYPFYRSQVGLFSIPLIFYSPVDSLLRGINRRTTQQIDIIPSILDYINFDHPFYSLGTSVFDKKEEGYAVNLMNENYQLINDVYSLVINATEKNSLYKFTEDSTLKNNLSGKDTLLERKMEIKLFSVIQNFNQTMIKNQMK